MANDQQLVGRHASVGFDITSHTPSTITPTMAADDDITADLDEPPEPKQQSQLAPLTLKNFTPTTFNKNVPKRDQQTSLLTSALLAQSPASSPIEDRVTKNSARGLSYASTWSNNSVTTAELTSDGGFTSPISRASTPSPPPPASSYHMMPLFNKKPFDQPVSVVSNEDDSVSPLQTAPTQPVGEKSVEAALGRKRCIMFACGKKEEKKPVEAPPKPAAATPAEPPKRVCTIKFACPAKISTIEPSPTPKPRMRMVSPAPMSRRLAPKSSPKIHRDSDSTVRNSSPISVRKVPARDHARRLSLNSDLAKCEAYRFHEFGTSEEEAEEWTMESTCHRNRLTVGDTLKVENNLRKLGEEVEAEELDEEADEDDDDADMNDDEDDDELLDDDQDDSDALSDTTDEGFQTDDEGGFAVSDGESNADSEDDWWAPGASTAATSIEQLEQLRMKTTRTVSESSIGSLSSRQALRTSDKLSFKRRKSKPVNIRISTPELPDSTDFVCGTLDEDRPAEEAYMSTLERRRAAKHKPTPQDIDPTFPASDPELIDEEDEEEEIDNLGSESEHLIMHGRMEPVDGDLRGRCKETLRKRSPAPSPKRLRSPPPATATKRLAYRSPPPRKLFDHSPKRLPSPAPKRLRSPPPTRRGSVNPLASKPRTEMRIRFGGIGERPPLGISASVPRTPTTLRPIEFDDNETGPNELPVRRVIDIQVGLEKKRQRRREQLYRKQHRKAAKEKRPPPPGRGAERMREMGLAVAAHRGRQTTLTTFELPLAQNPKDMHVLSI